MKKAVVVTGASGGIGSAIAHEYAKNGYFVYLMGRNKEALQQVAMGCRFGASIESCDLQDKAALHKRIDEMISNKIHRIETLVNNAGIYSRGTTEGTDLKIWQTLFEVNLFSAVEITKEFIPYFKNYGGGSIVNITSTLGSKPTAETAAYSASKAAMINWTLSLALELAPHQIRANCISPGIVETPIHGLDQLSPDERLQTIKKIDPLQPLGRIGQPQDIAKAAYFLGSPDSSWTTGALLNVDGGINIT